MPPQVTDREIEWMLSTVDPIDDPERLTRDLGREEAREVREAFEGRGHEACLGLLAWPGIATRWRTFLDWLSAAGRPEPREAFAGYARSLGRRTGYRALALTSGERAAIDAADTILPTGRLRADEASVRATLDTMGLRPLMDARVHRIGSLELDPSLSIHDHPETAVTIAAGYMDPPERVIHRFELDLPVIETLGWRIIDTDGFPGWFEHRGVLFDRGNPRTERFLLFEIPFFSQRCRTERVFSDPEEVDDYVRAFAFEQKRRHRPWYRRLLAGSAPLDPRA